MSGWLCQGAEFEEAIHCSLLTARSIVARTAPEMVVRPIASVFASAMLPPWQRLMSPLAASWR